MIFKDKEGIEVQIKFQISLLIKKKIKEFYLYIKFHVQEVNNSYFCF